MTSESGMPHPVLPDEMNHQNEESGADELGHNRCVQGPRQAVTVCQSSNHHGGNRHRAEIYKEIEKTERARAALRRHQIVDGGGERAVIPAQEECSHSKERQECEFALRMDREVDQ